MIATPVFVDSAQYIAFLHQDDDLHQAAEEVAELLADTPLVTTEGILVEVLNFLSRLGPNYRRQAVALVELLKNEATLLIEPQTTELLDAGVDLYSRRLDKSYSLTDCMSILTCRKHGITEVATSDHDFEQEGFTILLA